MIEYYLETYKYTTPYSQIPIYIVMVVDGRIVKDIDNKKCEWVDYRECSNNLKFKSNNPDWVFKLISKEEAEVLEMLWQLAK